MTTAAERYAKEWSLKTGRKPSDVYIPRALREEKGRVKVIVTVELR